MNETEAKVQIALGLAKVCEACNCTKLLKDFGEPHHYPGCEDVHVCKSCEKTYKHAKEASEIRNRCKW